MTEVDPKMLMLVFFLLNKWLSLSTTCFILFNKSLFYRIKIISYLNLVFEQSSVYWQQSFCMLLELDIEQKVPVVFKNKMEMKKNISDHLLIALKLKE